jgi:putative ABC transport system ATP-binding protein
MKKINSSEINLIIEHLLNYYSIKINKLDFISALTQNIERNKHELSWSNIERIFLRNKLKVFCNTKSFSEAIKQSSEVVPWITYTETYGWIAIMGDRGPWVKFLVIGKDKKSKLILSRDLVKSMSKDITWFFAEPTELFSGGTADSKYPHYYSRLFHLIKVEISDIKILTIFSVAIVVLSLVVPVGTQSFINILSFGTQFQPILVLTVFVTILLGIAGILRIFQTEVAEILQQKLFIRLVSEISEKLGAIRSDYLRKKKIEEIINYFLDISIIQKSATVLLVDGLSVLLQFIVGLLVLILYHPFFILLDIILFIFIFFFIFNILGKQGVETSIYESKAKHKIVNWFEEIASNLRLFRSGNMNSYALKRTEILSKIYLENRRNHYKILIRQIAGLTILQAAGMGIVLGIGGYLVILGELSLGQLVAAELIVSKILDSFGKFGKYLESYYDLLASVDKIGNLLDIPLETSGEVIYEKTLIGVDLKLSKLKLSDKNGCTLNIDSLEIKRGSNLGVYSTDPQKVDLFLSCLYGLAPQMEGRILVNGRYSLQELDLSSWRDAVGYLSNDHLFSGNIYENIKAGRMGIDSKLIRDILERVGILKGILENHEDGLNTEISATGYPINKSELFRLNLARSIAEIPDLLLIDRVCDNISEEERKLLLDIIDTELETSTVVIISQSKENLTKCDTILEL